eukprot:Nk52_evm38s210 gene=Nk52_evmTU38s210
MPIVVGERGDMKSAVFSKVLACNDTALVKRRCVEKSGEDALVENSNSMDGGEEVQGKRIKASKGWQVVFGKRTKKEEEEEGPLDSFIDLQLSRMEKIQSLCIVNSGSAFVEVLVADSQTYGTAGSGDLKKGLMKVLLPMIMLKKQKKDTKEEEEQYWFRGNDLNSKVAACQWDVVRVVCRQPYCEEGAGFGIKAVYVNGDQKGTTAHDGPNPAELKTKKKLEEAVTKTVKPESALSFGKFSFKK